MSKYSQKTLFAQAIRKYGSAAEASKWVAPPLVSHHPWGVAIDVNYPDEPIKDWLLEEFIIDFDYDIRNEEIECIYRLDYLNRLTIKYKGGLTGLLFINLNSSALVIEYIRQNFNNIKIAPFIKVFEEDNNEKKKEIETSEESKTQDKNKDNETQESEEETIAFICFTKVSSFIDIFKFLFSEKEIITGSKIVVIKGGKLFIYKEKFAELLEVNFTTLLENPKQIQDCYKKIAQYDLNDLVKIQFWGADEVGVGFSNYTLNLKLFDDLSYVKLKKALYAYSKNFQLSFDDVYENIK